MNGEILRGTYAHMIIILMIIVEWLKVDHSLNLGLLGKVCLNCFFTLWPISMREKI